MKKQLFILISLFLLAPNANAASGYNNALHEVNNLAFGLQSSAYSNNRIFGYSPELARIGIELVHMGHEKFLTNSATQNGITALSWLAPIGEGITFLSNIIRTGAKLITKQAVKGGLTNPQLVQKSATLAERAIGGQGPVAGIAKHKYATNLLDRYQSIYGHRGLSPNHSFNNGVGNRGILDVLDRTNGIIYDFKFGKAVMSPAQYNKYFNNFGLPIQVIRP